MCCSSGSKRYSLAWKRLQFVMLLLTAVFSMSWFTSGNEILNQLKENMQIILATS